MHATPEPPNRMLQVAWACALLGVTLRMLLSANTLLWMGIPYDAPFGPPFVKIHPSSYLLFVALLLGLTGRGNPLHVFAGELRKQPLLGMYFFGMVLIFVWVIYRHGVAGETFIVEALWIPAIAAFVLNLFDASRHRQMLTLVMVMLVFNACVALGESVFKFRLFPLIPWDGSEVVAEEFFRASSLLGHPLENALVTVILLPAIALMPWPLWVRLGVVALQLLAMLSFGGRSSLAIGCLVYGGLLVTHVVGGVVRGRYSYVQLVGGCLGLVVGITLLLGLVMSTGIGERIFQNMQWDNSASVRARVWNAFSFMDTSDLWFGLSFPEIDLVKLKLGLDPRYEAIENYWIYLIMNLGIVGFTPFFLGLLCLIVQLLRKANAPMRAAILVFFVVGSAANTLAAKTSSLILLTIVVITVHSVLTQRTYNARTSP